MQSEDWRTKEHHLSTSEQEITRDQQNIETAPFHVALVFDDAVDILWAWQNLFHNICDDHAPWKEVKIRNTPAQWMSSDISIKQLEKKLNFYFWGLWSEAGHERYRLNFQK